MKSIETVEALTVDITKIKRNQEFGYPTKYSKLEFLKHKRTKINDINYNTKKADLIVMCKPENSEHLLFIYRQNINNEIHYFRRYFDQFREWPIEVVDTKYVIDYYNKNNNSIF